MFDTKSNENEEVRSWFFDFLNFLQVISIGSAVWNLSGAFLGCSILRGFLSLEGYAHCLLHLLKLNSSSAVHTTSLKEDKY
jgi:hypothetical protein